MRPLLALFLFLPLQADPEWRAPSSLGIGDMTMLELREGDPSRPPLGRPPLDERIGTLRVRSVEPTADGRGWRIQVLPLGPGTVVLTAMDLGEGRRSPELRLKVLRTVPFGGPWMGIGGGAEDELPELPFPWLWTSVLLVPFAGAGYLGVRRWRRGALGRARRRALKAFRSLWPPGSQERRHLDAAHLAGRDLLALHRGEEARSWGREELRRQQLEPWATWVESLDAARFSRAEPPFPPLETLLQALRSQGRP
ncbi:MAG: hypothetical protein HY823_04950 [Acidobacteria bacterium]|nr:hypothetical protein [Acidobacteriota bacterium]